MNKVFMKAPKVSKASKVQLQMPELPKDDTNKANHVWEHLVRNFNGIVVFENNLYVCKTSPNNNTCSLSSLLW